MKGFKARIEDGKFDEDWKNSEMIYVLKKLETQLGITERKETEYNLNKDQSQKHLKVNHE